MTWMIQRQETLIRVKPGHRLTWRSEPEGDIQQLTHTLENTEGLGAPMHHSNEVTES